MIEFSSGKKIVPQRVVIYGPEGIGKTTLASKFPDPVFVDVEQGSLQLDVMRCPHTTSWTMFADTIKQFTKRGWHDRQTLVIDTADKAEQLCISNVCDTNSIQALGGQNDYGHSYNLLYRQWNRFLDVANQVWETGMNVVILAHSQLRKFEQPDEQGAYDRYELKLEKKNSASLKEWPDMLLFVNYKTRVVEVDKKKKAKGGKRVVFATHTPSWDAKNRHGLPSEFDLDYSVLAPHIPCKTVKVVEGVKYDDLKPSTKTDEPPTENVESKSLIEQAFEELDNNDLSPLMDLMKRDGVTEKEVQAAIHRQGYFPADTPLKNIPNEFVRGVLIAKWNGVFNVVKKLRKESENV